MEDNDRHYFHISNAIPADGRPDDARSQVIVSTDSVLESRLTCCPVTIPATPTPVKAKLVPKVNGAATVPNTV